MNVHVGVISREYACAVMTLMGEKRMRGGRKRGRGTVQRETEKRRAQNNSRQPGG